MIRWSVQKDYITIPKSATHERIVENTDLFDFTISDEDMKILVSYKLLILYLLNVIFPSSGLVVYNKL